jgi:hypothetical protein
MAKKEGRTLATRAMFPADSPEIPAEGAPTSRADLRVKLQPLPGTGFDALVSVPGHYTVACVRILAGTAIGVVGPPALIAASHVALHPVQITLMILGQITACLLLGLSSIHLGRS